MKDFFDTNNRSELPEKFLWENMESGILDKMNKLKSEEVPSKKSIISKHYFLWASLLILFTILTNIGLQQIYINKANPNVKSTKNWSYSEQHKIKTLQKKTRKQDVKVNLNTPTYPNGISSINNSRIPNNKIQKEINNINIGKANIDISKTSAQNPIKKGWSDISKNVAGVIQKNKASHFNKIIQKERKQTIENITKPNLEFLTNEETDEFYMVLAKELTAIHTFSNVEKLSSMRVKDIINAINIRFKKDSSLFSKYRKQDHLPNKQLCIETGIVFWRTGSKQKLPERNQYEHNLPSYQIQGLYKWSMGSQTFLLTGVQYQRLNSQLNYRSTIPNYLLVLTDTVIRINRNVTTGEIEKVYGNVEQFVEADRLVVHHNTTDLFKILLGGGKEWNSNDFKTEIFGGLTLNTAAINRGRTVINSEIITYEGNSSGLINNRIYAEIFGGGRLQYRVNPHVSISSGLQFQQSLKNWSDIQNGVMYPFSVGFNFGMHYGF